ncbi:MAG: flagellar biosynthesis anti-sigma factor FlgM [Parasphingorhabdus sp.]
MKPNESYSVMIRRLERSGLTQAARKGGAGREAADKEKGSATKPEPRLGLSTERPTFDAQKVDRIKLQIAFGIYHIDMDRLAATLLDDGVVCANQK